MQQSLFSTVEKQLPEIQLIQMSPREFSGLSLNYIVFQAKFGQMLAASSDKGIACLLFVEPGETPEDLLCERFPECSLLEEMTADIKTVMDYVHGETATPLRLHVKGTDFQISVWNQLIAIPEGRTLTYTDVADKLGDKKANRAVGNAVGANPVALVIPCHRIIREDTKIGNYRWGAERKRRILFEETEILFDKIS